jgi:RNA 3'-terminal phosphate cyclase
MGDIVVPYLVLTDGTSEVTVSRVTQHIRTNVKVAEWLTGVKFSLQDENDKPGRMLVKGLRLMP